MNRRQFLKSLAGLAGVAAGAKIAPVLPEVAKAAPIATSAVEPLVHCPAYEPMIKQAPDGSLWAGGPFRYDYYMVGYAFQQKHHRAATEAEWEQYWYSGKLEPLE